MALVVKGDPETLRTLLRWNNKTQGSLWNRTLLLSFHVNASPSSWVPIKSSASLVSDCSSNQLPSAVAPSSYWNAASQANSHVFVGVGDLAWGDIYDPAVTPLICSRWQHCRAPWWYFTLLLWANLIDGELSMQRNTKIAQWVLLQSILPRAWRDHCMLGPLFLPLWSCGLFLIAARLLSF